MNDRVYETNTREGDLLANLDFAFVPECEHRNHSVPRQRRFHDDGPAMWLYVPSRNECCGYLGRTVYVCDGFKRSTEANGMLRCRCGFAVIYSGRFVPIHA